MKQLGVHLGGSVEVLESFGIEAAKQGIRTFQVHLSNPRNWDAPNGDAIRKFVRDIKPIIDDSENRDLNLIVHGPFGVSLAKSNHYQYIMRYFVEVSKIMEDLGLSKKDKVRLVTHVGSRVLGVPLADVVTQISNLCMTWAYYTVGHKSILCLENDAGSKRGTKLGSVKFLKNVFSSMDDVPRVRMCWDTEHAFANGMNVSNRDVVESVLTFASVVHLNSIPSYVVRGGHLDRHSDVLIENGQELEGLVYIAKRCVELDIPMILERSRGIVMDDVAYLGKRFRNGWN